MTFLKRWTREGKVWASTSVISRQPAHTALQNAHFAKSQAVVIDLSQHANALETLSAQGLSDSAQAHGLAVILHGDFKARTASSNPEALEQAKLRLAQECELARALDAPLIVHANALDAAPGRPLDPRRAEAAFIEVVNGLDPQVELWLENMPRFPLEHRYATTFCTSAQIARVLDACPRASLLLDVGHYHVGGQDPCEGLEQYLDRCCALTLSDNDGRRDNHAPLGTGGIDFYRLASRIVAHQWSGALLVDLGARPAKEAYESGAWFLGLLHEAAQRPTTT